MTRKTTKAAKNIKTPNEIIDGWFARQDMSVAGEAKMNWEAGQIAYTDYTQTICGETVVTHCERYFADDESGRFIVVCWDENGNITFGGM